MKKVLFLLIPTLLMCGCSSGAGGTSGRIDCSVIQVSSWGKVVFNGNYSASAVGVYEYKDDSGNKLYLNTRFKYQEPSSGSYRVGDSELRVYKTRYETEYVPYTFSSFIGWLLAENNYYFDLGSRTIDSELKFSEYLYRENPSSESADNKAAIAAARKGYYLSSVSGYTNNYVELRLDLVEKGLERHAYIQLGSDAIVSYQEKYF